MPDFPLTRQSSCQAPTLYFAHCGGVWGSVGVCLPTVGGTANDTGQYKYIYPKVIRRDKLSNDQKVAPPWNIGVILVQKRDGKVAFYVVTRSTIFFKEENRMTE